VNISLRDDQIEALSRRAELEGTSIDAIVVRAIDDYLTRAARQALVRETALKYAASHRGLLDRLE
jgi:hypothetical protein